MTAGLVQGSHIARWLLAGAALAASALTLMHTPAGFSQPGLLAAPILVLAVLGLGGWALNVARAPGTVWWVLCADVLAAGTAVALLPATLDAERMAFMAGFLVSGLVAAMGRRRVAALAGAAAGAMVCVLGVALVLKERGTVTDLALSGLHLLVVVAVAFEVAWVCAALHADSERRATRDLLARELRNRDAETNEMLLLAQALAQSEGPKEVAEALLKHLRRHFDLQAHAVALEQEGEILAFWEERSRLEADPLSARRERLQQVLAEAGHGGVIQRLTPRSIDAGDATLSPPQGTWLALPLKVQETIVGVVLLADARRDALEPARISAFGDLARRTGDALARIARARGEETRRMTMLLRQMREGVLLLGPEGGALLANPAARHALGMAGENAPLPERLGEVALADLARTPPGVARHFRVQVARGDDARPMELTGTAVGILEGRKRLGTLVTLRDVTEEELGRRRLVQAEKMTLVGQTLAGVAHELNNPLAALVGYADLLKTAAVPEPLQRPIQQMRDQAVRATRIVRNLLNFARRRNPQRVSVQLADLIHGTVELFAYEARMNEVTVDVTVDPSLPVLLADPHALQQVLVNLVQNGIHALAGSERQPRRIAIAAQVVEDAVVVQVADNGPGVPATLATRIFEPFFTTKAAGHGTGLGLALARAVAREHGGDLALDLDRREGACFTLRLPVRHAAPGSDAPDAVGERTLVLPGSVLVVDDEASVRESLVAQIGHLGIRVESAADAQEAQRMLARGRYEAVLLDVRMPGGSGLELHETLKQRDGETAQRIVFMTGDIVNDDTLAKLRETGNPYLEKPFTITELKQAFATSVARTAAAATAARPRERPWFGTATA